MHVTIEQRDGKWPDEARTLILDKMEEWTGDHWQEYVAAELLDALAALSTAYRTYAETPTQS